MLCSTLVALFVCSAAPAHAQDATTRTTAPPRVTIDGPEPPVSPATITRAPDGDATVRAIHLTAPIQLDGRLDEDVYRTEQPFGGFIQVAPVAGAPSSERTDVWVMYDDTNIYVTCRCWDDAPPEQWVANELRRDTAGLRNNDHFGVMFDTFYDRRSGFMFYANPLGARADYSVVDEGSSNTDWNPVWDVKGGRFDGGWIVEMAIPFKTLRYQSGPGQVWGLQMRRSIRRKNEWTYLTPVPAYLAGPQALNRVSAAGTLVGLDLPPASKNLELKPYAISSVTTDRTAVPALSNDFDGTAGGDLKYGVTANLTLDVTVNTDFAQVEVDEQQVNLTRFSLFFPEKRDFFLEGRGVFDFARGGTGAGGGGGTSDTPYLFYSRRIGLNAGRVIPIDVGGRLTGKVGPWALGVMNIQAGDESVSGTPATNFTVLRVKHDILRRSAIGAMFTNRSVSPGGGPAGQSYGVDAAFSFFQNVQAGAYYARTESPHADRDSDSYQARFDYLADRYGFQAEHLKVGEAFNPQVGFVRRDDFVKTSVSARFSPRPQSIEAVRKFTWEGGVDYYENGAGVLESRVQNLRFNTELETSDQITVEANRNFERLFVPFGVGGGVSIAPGGYDFSDVKVSYQVGQQRRVSGTLSVQRGEFYDGTLTALGLSSGRVSVTNHLSVEPSLTFNDLDLPAGRVIQRLVRARTDYAFSPRMFASGLVQYNSSDRTFSSNLRYRWEYRPGSELFLVWTDERDTRPNGTGLRNRAFVVKVTRLFRF
ncbi:MAG: DUF5916 domain-containing protein [Vicinamibacterales bacterium]